MSHSYHSTRCLLPHRLLLKPPLHAMGTHQLSSLQPIYQLCPKHADVFEDTPQPSNEVFALVARKFLFFAISSFFFFLLEFTLVEFDLFLSFLSAANALASTVAILSARNLISKRVSLSKFTVCLLVGIPSTTSNCRIPNKVRTKFA